MKPRYEEVSYETTLMLEKAKIMNDRLNTLEKAKCDCGEEPCKCKDCPKCDGGKLNKMGSCMKADCDGKMAKAQPGFPPEKITDVNPHFVAESGGQTKSGYFTTNGKTIETEDGKPKRKKHDSKVNMDKLSSRQNPHSDTGVVREENFD